jgi:hypothetical protein
MLPAIAPNRSPLARSPTRIGDHLDHAASRGAIEPMLPARQFASKNPIENLSMAWKNGVAARSKTAITRVPDRGRTSELGVNKSVPPPNSSR